MADEQLDPQAQPATTDESSSPDPVAEPAQEPAPAADTLGPGAAVVSDAPAPTSQQVSADPTPAVPSPEPAPVPEPSGPAQPVTVDQFTRRSDEDALEGSQVTVISGEHAGQNAAFRQVVESDPQTGYPRLVLVRFQSANYTHEYATVPYADVRPAQHPGSQ